MAEVEHRARAKRLDGIEHPLVLSDDMLGAASKRFRQGRDRRFVRVAKRTDPEKARGLRALFTPLVVWRIRQAARDLRVNDNDHQPGILKAEARLLDIKGTAID